MPCFKSINTTRWTDKKTDKLVVESQELGKKLDTLTTQINDILLKLTELSNQLKNKKEK